MEIEKNIQIPKKAWGRPKKYPIDSMAYGDSFFIPCDHKDKRTWQTRIVNYANRHAGQDYKIISRAYPEGVRFWKVKA